MQGILEVYSLTDPASCAASNVTTPVRDLLRLRRQNEEVIQPAQVDQAWAKNQYPFAIRVDLGAAPPKTSAAATAWPSGLFAVAVAAKMAF